MRALTAIIPFWNGHDSIGRLLQTLPADLPVIVVDDHSDKALDLETLDWEAGDIQTVEVLRPRDKGYFSGAVNVGIQACDTDVVILNQDLWFRGHGWLDYLEGLRGRYGIIGDGVMRHPAWPKGYVQGTLMYVARAVIDAVGLLNERDYPLWGATCEYQLRACRRGFGAHPTVAFGEWMSHEERPKGSKFGAAITEAIRRQLGNRQLFIRTPPAVSVVVPSYNYGRYLEDCVNSLIGGDTCLGPMEGQTFQSFEIIIVDDASTDETAQLGPALADPWKGIRYIRHRTNRGTPQALNTGVAAARGQYVTIVSADDMLESWHLDTLYRVCEGYPHRVAYGDLMQLKAGRRDKALKLPGYDFEKLLDKNPMSAGIMYPKAAWKEVGGYAPEMAHGREDWAFNIALGIKGWCGIHVGGKPGYLIRREKQNRSLTTATRDWYIYFRRQLVGLFPGIYAGDRPMGCCGGRRTNPVSKSSKTNPTAASRREIYMREVLHVGAKGMTLVVFQQDINAPRTFYGPVTGAAYQFGGKRKIGRVDPRDLRTGTSRNPGLLEMYEKGQLLFKETTDPGPPPPKKVVVKPEAHEPEELVDVSKEEGYEHEDDYGPPLIGDTITLDPGDMKVSEIRALSGLLTLEQWEAMRGMELAGKARKSALEFIKAAINNLGG